MRLTSSTGCLTLLVAASGAALPTLLGCGLIDPNISKVSFNLPTEAYAFDASTLNLPSGSTAAVPCGTGVGQVADCCNPPAPLPAPDCSMTPISCENGVCTAEVIVSQSQSLDLRGADPRLTSASGLANLTISQISYVVVDNTLNVDLPPIVLFLAPNGVTSASDPQAKKFGTVPAIAQGSTPSGNVMLESDAGPTFSGFAQNLSVPISLIATTTVSVPSGSPIPAGKIDVNVTGRLSGSIL